MVRRRHAGAYRAVRRSPRRGRRRADAGQCRGRGARGARVGRLVSAALLPRGTARGIPRRRRARFGDGRARRRSRAARRRHAPGAVPGARGFPPARGARLHRRRPRAVRHSAAAAFHQRAILRHPGRHGRALRRPSGSARQLGGHRAALQPDDPARQGAPAGISHARRRDDRRAPAQRSRRGTRATARAALPRCRRARREARRIHRRASTSRRRRSCRWASPATS